MKNACFILIALLALGCRSASSTKTSKFNFGFERNEFRGEIPDRWFQWGTYPLSIDSVSAYSGKYAAMITASQDSGAFGCIAYSVPAYYQGDSIRLEGYIKLDAVEDGFAGLLLRVDGDNTQLVFNNMAEKQINGTRDWAKYTVTLPYPRQAKSIYVGGLLVGKGSAWFDDFSLSIDGKDLENLEEIDPTTLYAQLDTEFDDGSHLAWNALNGQELENLYWLGKIWGFLKYYHPAVSEGDLNWDYQLFRLLPAIKERDFVDRLDDWIGSLGEVKPGVSISQNNAAVKLQPRLDWLVTAPFADSALGYRLLAIQKAERNQENYYLSFVRGIGNPNFSTEMPYPDMDWSDDGYRLLALFRYWNIIEYFFPYRHLMDENWDDVLKAFLPRMLAADEELSYKLCLLELIGKIQDTHANIWQRDSLLTYFYGEKTVPLDITFIENKPVVIRIMPGLEADSKIRVGDVITAIDGQPVAALITELLKYCPASNYPTQLRDVARRLLRTNQHQLALELERGAEVISESPGTVPWGEVHWWETETASHRTLADGTIGYIFPGKLNRGEIDTIMPDFMNKKGLIVDLRCYPSEFIVFSLSKYLMPQPTEFVKFTQGSLMEPGRFSFGSTLKVGENRSDYFKGKVVLLINETTQSQAEYTAMALRVAPKVTVIGSTTAGADGNVSPIFLPGNVRTMISGIGVYYPDGTETQRIGIVPDIPLRPTIEGIREGRDELLENAIAVINQDADE